MGLVKAVYKGPGFYTATQRRNISWPSSSMVRQRLKASPTALAAGYIATQWLLGGVTGVAVLLSPISTLTLARTGVVLLGLTAQALLLDRSLRASRFMALHALAALALLLFGEAPGPARLPLALAYGSSLLLATFFSSELGLPTVKQGKGGAVGREGEMPQEKKVMLTQHLKEA
jgi:hypothetical protein